MLTGPLGPEPPNADNVECRKCGESELLSSPFNPSSLTLQQLDISPATALKAAEVAVPVTTAARRVIARVIAPKRRRSSAAIAMARVTLLVSVQSLATWPRSSVAIATNMVTSPEAAPSPETVSTMPYGQNYC